VFISTDLADTHTRIAQRVMCNCNVMRRVTGRDVSRRKTRADGGAPSLEECLVREAVGLTDCAHAHLAVYKVTPGGQSLAVDFEQVDFFYLRLQDTHSGGR
jgi:hypothetical protein